MCLQVATLQISDGPKYFFACKHIQKKQCRIDTAEEKEPCKQGKTARLWGKGKLFHSDSNGD